MNRLLLLPKQACRTHNWRFNHSTAAGHYDIIISGGGMVGFAMACSLGKSDRLMNQKILLLESSSYRKLNLTDYSPRVCALNSNSKSLLEYLGAWEHIVKARYSTVKKMQVWDACSDAVITFGRADLSEEIAWIVENNVVQDSLTKELKKQNQVEVRYQSKVMNYRLPKEADAAVHVTLEDGSHLTADLIIGADGYNSGLRHAMKTQYITYDYNQIAVVATLRISEVALAFGEVHIVYDIIDKNFSAEHGERHRLAKISTVRPHCRLAALSKVLPACYFIFGWTLTAHSKFLAFEMVPDYIKEKVFVQLSNNLSSLVWSTDETTAQRLMDLSPEIFTDRVNHAIWNNEDKNHLAQNVTEQMFQVLKVCRMNSIKENASDDRQLPPSVVGIHGHQAAFPLSFGHAVDYISHKAVLVGDAAHRVHPLAGQGVNLGFGDVIALNQVINEAIDNGSDHGNYLYLRKYQSNRQLDNFPVMAAIHGLHLLYGTKLLPQVFLRSLGLTVFDSLTSVKKFITQRASA